MPNTHANAKCQIQEMPIHASMAPFLNFDFAPFVVWPLLIVVVIIVLYW